MIEHRGIYFELAEDEYHADPALGSTDLRRLMASGPDYWWHSSLNPTPPPAKTMPAIEYGKALHKLVLEGRQMFEANYVQRPPDLAKLDAKTKAELAPNGQTVLATDDYDAILFSAAQIASNPGLVTAFEGGQPEVSIFWHARLDDGYIVPCKARWDYLKVRGIGDLKSIRNIYGKPFGEACIRSITDYRYDIQAAHYLIGRGELAHFVQAGLVHGDHDPAWLERVAQSPSYAFQWVFYQAQGAPIVWSRSLSWGNPILEIAMRDRHKALETYRDYKQTFPTGMWRLNEPVSELQIDAMPGWYR